MRKLIDGVQDFQRNAFDAKRSRFEELKKGQHPLALFITCSDSRIDPNLITQTEPGELFVIRNAGNLVPAYSDREGGEAGTIEYAVSVLKVQDVVICGHSHCGAMGGLLDPDSVKPLPAVSAWLKHAEATRRIIAENFSHVSDPAARLAAAVQQNVLVQLENLRTHPSVAAAVSRGQLNLHGWVYEFETGQVYAHDPASGNFLSLDGQGIAQATAGESSP